MELLPVRRPDMITKVCQRVAVRDTTYPGAKWVDRTRFGGVTMPHIPKLVHHSTETSGLPSYPSFAPNLTIDPWTRDIWQHMPLNQSASTLRNAGDYRTNRVCCQIEWVMYCDPARQSSGHHISKLGDDEYRFMAQVVAWFNREWGIPFDAPSFVAYPGSYGQRAAQRFSVSRYDGYTGQLGHQHVPGNDHGDPGNIDMARILRYAEALTNKEEDNDDMPTPADVWDEPIDASGHDAKWYLDSIRDSVLIIGTRTKSIEDRLTAIETELKADPA